MNRDQFEKTTGIDPTCQRLHVRRNRLKEFVIDPSSGSYSMSRLCLGVMNLAGVIGGLYLAYIGQGTAAVGIIAGIAASDAGVYFASTRKQSKIEDE